MEIGCEVKFKNDLFTGIGEIVDKTVDGAYLVHSKDIVGGHDFMGTQDNLLNYLFIESELELIRNRKLYMVQTIDMWQNVELIGLFTDLKTAEKIINESIDFTPEEPLDLVEYASTFSMIFDTSIEDADGEDYLRIFGYIFEQNHKDGLLMPIYKESGEE